MPITTVNVERVLFINMYNKPSNPKSIIGLNIHHQTAALHLALVTLHM